MATLSLSPRPVQLLVGLVYWTKDLELTVELSRTGRMHRRPPADLERAASVGSPRTSSLTNLRPMLPKQTMSIPCISFLDHRNLSVVRERHPCSQSNTPLVPYIQRCSGTCKKSTLRNLIVPVLLHRTVARWKDRCELRNKERIFERTGYAWWDRS